MFKALVAASLNQRLFVIVASLLLAAYGAVILPRLPVDVSRISTGPPSRFSPKPKAWPPRRSSSSSPIRLRPPSTACRCHPPAVRFERRPLDRLCGIRPGERTSIATASSRPSACDACARQLPAGVHPEMGPVSFIMGEIMLIAVSGKSVSPMELREIADFAIRPQLLTIAGVAQVIPNWRRSAPIPREPRSRPMQRLDMTPAMLDEAIKGFGTNAGGGFIDQYAREYLIRNIGRTTSPRGSPQSRRCGQGRPVHSSPPGGVRRFRPRSKRGMQASRARRPSLSASRSSPLPIPSPSRVPSRPNSKRSSAPCPRASPPTACSSDSHLHRNVHREREVCAGRGRRRRCVRFDALPARLARDGDLSQPHPHVDLHDRARVPRLGLSINTMTLGGIAIAIGELVERCGGGRRERAPPLEAQRGVSIPPAASQRRARCEPRGPLEHRLCHSDCRARLRAALCHAGSRGSAFPPAGSRQHRLHSREPRHLRDIDARLCTAS